LKKIHGNIKGIRPNQLRRLERLYRRRIPPTHLVTPELARFTCELSLELGRQVALLIDRRGQVRFVVVGDARGLFLPDLSEWRLAAPRLRGLRLVHTHLNGEGLNEDDFTDLALLRLDSIAAITVNPDGLPGLVRQAHLLPPNPDEKIWEELDPVSVHQLEDDFLQRTHELEREMARALGLRSVAQENSRTILASVVHKDSEDPEESLAELEELANTCGLNVVDRVIQKRSRPDPKYLMGKGKLKDLVIRGMQKGAGLLIFDDELTPGQVAAISEFTDTKVMDRTMLILDIFAQHAHSRDGKIQVELAQLKYLLPRLGEKHTAMSRLTGGIGGRGPGETKLEMNRRRAQEKINRLERELAKSARARKTRRERRRQNLVPIISIVGYTNSGKSTLLNALTESDVTTEAQMFSTLDSASRRLRFPREREVIITDTVGFLRRLPPDLVAAFRSTLEELHDADLLLHLIDASSPSLDRQVQDVEKILGDLDLLSKPRLIVLNKIDRVPETRVQSLLRFFSASTFADAVPVSALKQEGFNNLLRAIETVFWSESKKPQERMPHLV